MKVSHISAVLGIIILGVSIVQPGVADDTSTNFTSVAPELNSIIFHILGINSISNASVGDVIHSSGFAYNYSDNTPLTVEYKTAYSTQGAWKVTRPVFVMNEAWSDSVGTTGWAPGVWTATVTDSAGASASTSFNLQPAYIIVIPNFTVNFTEPCLLDIPIQFNATSTGNPTAWSWSFGDGTTSTLQNPVHTFHAIGNYNVTLTVISGSWSFSTSKIIVVNRCPVPYSYVTISAWTKDGEYPVIGASVYLGRNGQFLGKTNLNGKVRVSVPYGTNQFFVKSPVYKKSYVYEGEWQRFYIMTYPPVLPAPTPSQISIRLDQKNFTVAHYVFNESNNNDFISMNKGSVITLELSENPTTLYQWDLNTTAGLLPLGETFIPNEGCCGFGGTHVWEMKLKSTMPQGIDGIYRRYFDPITGDEQRYTVSINPWIIIPT